MANYLLTFITFVPLAGVLLILLIPKEEERTIKQMSVGISFVPLVLSIVMWLPKGVFVRDRLGVDSDHRQLCRRRWLSIPLVFLTTLLTTLA